ncbi:MAG: YfhO family protein [Planctomycetes bacterium]|nr:YfhO family protein [Planctomycetota bacterium]
MLPLMEVAQWSAYQDFRLSFSSDGNLNLRHLVAFLNPWLLTDAQTDTSPGGYMGLTEQGVFQGFLGVALVLTVIFWLWRRAPLPRDVAFWVLLLTVQLLVMLGKAVHLHRVMALIPVYRLFHIPTRHVLVVGLAMSWLAALGLDLLLREEPARRRQLFRRTALGVAGLTLAALGMCVRMPYWPQGAPGLTYPPYWMMLGSAVAALILLRGVSRGRVGLATLVPVLTAVELWCYLHDFGMSPQAPLCYRQPQAFPDWVQWLRHQEQAGRPARYLVQNDLGSPGRSLPTAWGSGWGLSALDVYCNSMPAGLCRLLHLDGYGAAHFPAVFGEQRGLSAAGGQYIYAVAPLPAVAPHRGYCRYQACHLIWFRDGFGVSTPALLNSSGQEPTGDQEPGLIEAGTPSRLNLSGKKSAAWLGRLLELPAGSYLVDGQVACAGPWQGRLQVQLRTGPRHDERLLAEQVFEAGQDWGKALPFVFRFDHLGAPEEYRVSLRVESAAPVELTRLDWWQLQPDFAHRGPADPGEMCRCLHAGMQPIYPEVADFPPGKIYRNPEARDLVTLIEEVRPAADPLAAADALLAAERPVRELAYVIAPGGRSGNQDWTSPRKFAPGAARVLNSDPSDIRVRTTTAGEGFALFTVTRCWGWSATVDGQAAVLHAVDGPFMGVVVPAGVHEVRLVYRPLLVWIGMAVAGGVLGGAWLVWVVGRPRVGVMPGPVWALFSTVRRCSGLEYNQGRGRQHPYRRAEMERVDLEAVYENGTLKLPYPLPLEAGQRVMVTIHTIEATPRRRALIQWQGSWEDLEELILSDENDPLEAS